MRRLCPIDSRRTLVAETTEKEPEAETPSETQLEKELVALHRRSRRMPGIVVSSLALSVIGAAAIYTLPEPHIALPKLSSFTELFPKPHIALPKFSSLAELFPRETVSVPIPDPAVIATLKDMQFAQQRNAAALQENGATLQQNTGMLQQGTANLESLRQGFTAQQTNLKTISNQLSSLIARVDALQNAMTPLTTSSIPQPNVRARLGRTSRKQTSRLPNKPVGPVSIGGAPLNPAPVAGSNAG
jgi:hypothetical protein